MGGIVNERPEYRSILAVDIEKSSGRGNRALLTIREAFRRCLSESIERSGITWDDCLVEDLGDGLRVTTPAGTARTSLIHPLIHELVARLREHNRMHAEIGRIRVRMAVHSGDVFIGPKGIPAGSALTVLARMLDSRACRDALAKAPESTLLALLVSQHFYDETIAHGYVGIEKDEFRRVDVEEKEYAAGAWLYVLGPPDRRDEQACARLAAEAGEALVAAMPTPAWPTLRGQAVGLLHDAGPALEGILVPELDVNARMLAAAAPEHVPVLRQMLASRWREHLARILEANPGADEALRRLIKQLGAAAPATGPAGKVMTNIARDHSTLFAVMDGNIVQHHHGKPDSSDQQDSDKPTSSGRQATE